ncbi:MAG TPA: DUF192 domain-containing protein [Deferrisomatales bacterium]|nr:DUF192 domain-containing protein [Deferrisomatales bacterium]
MTENPSLRGARRWSLAAALLLAAATTSAAQFRSAQAVAFPREVLQITGTDGAAHPFTVEVARSPAQRARGLMFRTQLDPAEGMLFLYPSPQRARMWMKDTPLSLDMLFLAPDGRVLEIAARTEPLSLTTISSADPVLGVLELRGGRCAELGIAPGARVLHPAFAGGSAR